MRKLSAIIFFLFATITMVMAQESSERSSSVTLFKDFEPVIVVMKNGKTNNLRYGNIFLKASTLIYRQSSTSPIMEANMDVVKHVIFGKRCFVNLDNHLAETIDTIGDNYLVRVRTVDVETMKAEYLNDSNFTNFNMGEVFSFTRTDVGDKEMPYPLLDRYYYILKGKKLLAHERNVRNSLSKKRLEEYDSMTRSFFNWSNIDDLKKLFQFLCR